jgi:hypothetical protein
MGANAVTTVPVYVAAEVLTAADLNITNSGVPVFATTVTRDAAFGGAGEKTLAQGQFCYLESTGKLQVYTGSEWLNVGTTTNVTAFTAGGTFTPPAGVTYAVAYMTGGGGGIGASAGDGGNSSVAFAGGTVSATGGKKFADDAASSAVRTNVGAANSGYGAIGANDTLAYQIKGGDGAVIVAGGAVTPGVGITVTVAAGGTTGTPNGKAGGTGYVYISYEV